MASGWKQGYIWLSWLGLLLASFVAGFTSERWWEYARQDLRMASCFVLSVAAWRSWWSDRFTSFALVLLLVALGMTLGFYGDSHVGTRFWWPPVPHPIVGGILFFGLGHAAYMVASFLMTRVHSLAIDWSWWSLVLLWQLTGVIGWSAIALTSDKEIALRLPTLAYTLLVAGTPGLAFALAIKKAELWTWAIGAALFFASDLLLAWQLFHGAFPLVDELTWICYGFGQMLIVFGAAFGTRVDSETSAAVR